MAGIQLRSSAFGNNDGLPRRYAHAYGDTSPTLEWSGVPDGTAELALLVEDPDAPGGTFVHWALAGIPPTVSSIAEGQPPEQAVAGNNNFGTSGYNGPHPPPGDEPHRYVFRIYAVREPLDVSWGFTADALRRAMEGKVLASGELVGTYGR